MTPVFPPPSLPPGRHRLRRRLPRHQAHPALPNGRRRHQTLQGTEGVREEEKGRRRVCPFGIMLQLILFLPFLANRSGATPSSTPWCWSAWAAKLQARSSRRVATVCVSLSLTCLHTQHLIKPFHPSLRSLVWWHEATAEAPATCPVEWVPSEHPLFILYTSGSTGKPKGKEGGNDEESFFCSCLRYALTRYARNVSDAYSHTSKPPSSFPPTFFQASFILRAAT